MNFFLLYVSLPALLFGIMSKTPFAELNNPPFLIATTLGTASAFVLAMIVGRLLGRLSFREATLAGLAGVGDLVATCTSPRSRNRTFGESLGRGQTMEMTLQASGGHVVEGVTSCESVLALASSYDVEMPLTDAVHRVCHKGLSVDQAMALLLGRSTKPE